MPPSAARSKCRNARPNALFVKQSPIPSTSSSSSLVVVGDTGEGRFALFACRWRTPYEWKRGEEWSVERGGVVWSGV